MSAKAKPLSSLAVAAASAIAVLLVLIATPAPAAPISYKSGGTAAYVGATLTIPEIVDVATNPPALAPVLTNTGTATPAVLDLLGSGTFKAVASSANSSATVPSNSQLDFSVLGNVVQGGRNNGVGVLTRGYAINGLSLDFSGVASYVGNRANSTGSAISALDFTLQITEVNFQTLATPLDYDFGFTPSNIAFYGAGAQSRDWKVAGALFGADWTALKTSLGLTASDNVTGIRMNLLNAGLTSGVFRATTTNQVDAFKVSATTELVAVPEPPTVILAGLGVAAVVANGYRRRRLRRQDDGAESDLEASECEVALSA